MASIDNDVDLSPFKGKTIESISRCCCEWEGVDNITIFFTDGSMLEIDPDTSFNSGLLCLSVKADTKTKGITNTPLS